MFGTNLGDDGLQHADLRHEPVQFLITDAVLRRVTRTDIGLAQQFEAAPLEARLARPCGAGRSARIASARTSACATWGCTASASAARNVTAAPLPGAG